MTLEEKIAQLRHIHAYSIVDNGQLNYEKLEQLLDGPCDGRTACTDSADTKSPSVPASGKYRLMRKECTSCKLCRPTP